MLIIGGDYHPGLQQIAFVDSETGELGEQRLAHREEAEHFYGKFKEQNLAVRVGMESSGHSGWFEHLLRELGFGVVNRRFRLRFAPSGCGNRRRIVCAAVVEAVDRGALSAC